MGAYAVVSPVEDRYVTRRKATMGNASWRTVRRAFPGPVGLAMWITVAVPLPLFAYEVSHRWEEDQDVSTALRWSLAAVPVFAAMAAARWTTHTGHRRGRSALLTAAAVGTLVGTVLMAVTAAFYAAVMPLGGDLPWTLLGWAAPMLAFAGGAVGHLSATRWPAGRASRRRRYVVGALVTVAGALVAPLVVWWGAEDSTVRYDEGHYGFVGPGYASTGRSGVVVLPAAGRYAIMAEGFAPTNPDCRLNGPGLAAQRAGLVSIPPADYGGDAVSYSWVASFTVPAPGTYSLTCRTTDGQGDYTVGDVPEIRGAVASMIHWPILAFWLLGAVPGLLILASARRLPT
jgi:hypothetical protein